MSATKKDIIKRHEMAYRQSAGFSGRYLNDDALTAGIINSLAGEVLSQQKALDAVGGLQRYAVNQKIGLKGEYPLYADPTGSWYGVGDVEEALAKAEVKS